MKEVMERITVDPEVLCGKPVIKGTRIPIYLILEFLGCGMTEKEVLSQYPALKAEDIKAALLYAAKCMEKTRKLRRERTITATKREKKIIRA